MLIFDCWYLRSQKKEGKERKKEERREGWRERDGRTERERQ